MASGWAMAFLAAAVLSLAGTPLLRRLALAFDFVDRPGERKSQSRPIPYLGGVAIIGGVLVGLVFGTSVGVRTGVGVFGACVIGAVGILDDRRSLRPSTRVVVEVAVAGMAVAVGVRFGVTGMAVVDSVFTVVWLVAITNAFNLLDNMDGLAGGTAAVTGVAITVLAAGGGENVIAALAAALTGACVGFVVYNTPPAAIFMGDAGSLFVGFLLGLAPLELRPMLGPGAGIVVPAMMLAVPILDTTTVSLARLRRGRAFSQGGHDHLSHRLVARGLSAGFAVAILVGVQALCGVVAVLYGRGMLSLWWASGGVIVVLGILIAATIGAQVYEEPVRGYPRWLLVATGLVLPGFAALGAPATVALLSAAHPLAEAARLARGGLEFAQRGDRVHAAQAFDRASELFAKAQERLDGPLVSVGLEVPGLAQNLRAVRTLSALGSRLAASGRELAASVDPDALRISKGLVPIDEIERVAPELARAARTLATSRRALEQIDHAYLLPVVQHAVDGLDVQLVNAARSADVAADGARLLPAMMGGDGSRRYFLAVANNAELRATGGFIGNWGLLAVDRGHLKLERFRRISDLNHEGPGRRHLHAPEEFVRRYGRFEIPRSWQNVIMSPDFPTVGGVISDLYAQSTPPAVDGVISVDPPGLAAILELTGPVTVAGWPEPLTSANVVDVTLREAYERFPSDARVEFLGQVADAVWKAFTTRDLPRPAQLMRVLGTAVREKHVLLYSSRPVEEAFFDRVGASGRVAPIRSDALLVVNQNASGNKVDYYLQRQLDIRVALQPIQDAPTTSTVTARGESAPTAAALTTTLRLVLANEAPAGGLSRTAIGPFSSAFRAGENKTFVSIYTPLDFESAQVDGQSSELESARELGRNVYSRFVSIPPKSRRSLTLRLRGAVPIEADGWYSLDLARQAVLNADEVTVEISVPRGWRIAETVGLDAVGSRRAVGRFQLETDRIIRVRVAR